MNVRPSREEIRSEIVGLVSPAALPYDGESQVIRHWVLRTSTPLPTQADLEEMLRSLLKAAAREISKSYGAAPQADLERNYPGGFVTRLDDLHCVLSIMHPAHGLVIGNASLIATWGVIRGFDSLNAIEDVQGLPKEFWFEMRAVIPVVP